MNDTTIVQTIAKLREDNPINVKTRALNLVDLQVLDATIVALLQLSTPRDAQDVRTIWLGDRVQKLELLRAKLARLLSL